MAAFSSTAKRLKDALKALATALQYDTGSGPEAAFENVSDNDHGVFEGDPNLQVLPGQTTTLRVTSGEADKMYRYVLRIRIPMEDSDKSESAAFNQMYDLTELMVDAVLSADQANSLADGNEGTLGPIGPYMTNVTQGQWVVLTTKGGIELIADINCEITYSHPL